MLIAIFYIASTEAGFFAYCCKHAYDLVDFLSEHLSCAENERNSKMILKMTIMHFCLPGEFSSRQMTQETEMFCFNPQLSSSSY